MAGKTITIGTTVNAPMEKVWEYWIRPVHISQWCQASPDWHAPESENDLRAGGKFRTKMAAKDGSIAFDFEGTYDEVVPHEYIEYTIADGRKVWIRFKDNDGSVTIDEEFEMENSHPEEMQRGGWQSILDNFKRYTEAN